MPRTRKRMPKRKKAEQKDGRAPRERVRVLITGGRIQRRIHALAQEIRKDFPGEPLHLVSVLKGGVFFLTDLARNIPGKFHLILSRCRATGRRRTRLGKCG